MKSRSFYAILGLAALIAASVVMKDSDSALKAVVEPPQESVTAAARKAPPEKLDTAGQVLVLKVGGMTCGSCETKILEALKKEESVGRVTVSVERGLVAVESFAESPDIPSLTRTVTEAGYPATFAGRLKAMPDQANAKAGKKSGCGSGCCS